MKKTTLLLFAILLTSITVLAQQRQMNRKKITVLKTTYITNALELTPKEAQNFWPIFNMYNNKIQTLKMSLEGGIHRKIKQHGGIENITKENALKLIDEIILLEQKITNNKVELIQELNKIISAKKIIKLKKAQQDFNRQILHEYGKRKRESFKN